MPTLEEPPRGSDGEDEPPKPPPKLHVPPPSAPSSQVRTPDAADQAARPSPVSYQLDGRVATGVLVAGLLLSAGGLLQAAMRHRHEPSPEYLRPEASVCAINSAYFTGGTMFDPESGAPRKEVGLSMTLPSSQTAANDLSTVSRWKGTYKMTAYGEEPVLQRTGDTQVGLYLPPAAPKSELWLNVTSGGVACDGTIIVSYGATGESPSLSLIDGTLPPSSPATTPHFQLTPQPAGS